jgi:hypothetical protein
MATTRDGRQHRIALSYWPASYSVPGQRGYYMIRPEHRDEYARERRRALTTLSEKRQAAQSQPASQP